MNSAVVVLLVVLIGAVLYVVRLLAAPKKNEPDQSLLMLDQRLNELAKQVTAGLEHSRQAAEKSTHSVFSQVQHFTQGMTELKSAVEKVQERVTDVVSFQQLFNSPKLRGSWGELSLESILREYFPSGGFEMQHSFLSGEIVDAVLKLPNALLLPIDSKFSLENFKKMTEAEGDVPRQTYRKLFVSDVKKRIDEIATKYILPSEGTVDMALMYIPAESIYYEIIQNIKGDDVSEYARKRKIYLVSPNTLYITLTAVIHWFKDTEINAQIGSIKKRLEIVVKDATTLATDFRKLGDHLSDASSAYERSEKKLGHLVERTQKVIEMGQVDKKLE
jgi:DNA recombination protein RmuC